MENEMRGRSAFTGIPVVVSGFDEAAVLEAKKEQLKTLLRKASGEDDTELEAYIANRIREEQSRIMNGRTALSPVIGQRHWFRRVKDGHMFRCEASTFGTVAIKNDDTNESDVIQLNDGSGWKSLQSSHSYVRVSEIKKTAIKETGA